MGGTSISTTWAQARTLFTIFREIALILFNQLIESFFVPAKRHSGATEYETMKNAHGYSPLFVEDFFAKAPNLLLCLVFKTGSIIDQSDCHMLDLIVAKIEFKSWNAILQHTATPLILSVIWSLLGHSML